MKPAANITVDTPLNTWPEVANPCAWLPTNTPPICALAVLQLAPVQVPVRNIDETVADPLL